MHSLINICWGVFIRKMESRVAVQKMRVLRPQWAKMGGHGQASRRKTSSAPLFHAAGQSSAAQLLFPMARGRDAEEYFILYAAGGLRMRVFSHYPGEHAAPMAFPAGSLPRRPAVLLRRENIPIT